jgi:hypothetical protein
VKLNAIIHHGSYAAVDSGRPKAAIPIAVLGLVGTASGQNDSTDRSAIPRAGQSGNEGKSLQEGTDGQADAHQQPTCGELFSLAVGFWSLFAVQRPDAPLLTIRLTSNSTAVVLWPSASEGFVLQENSDLNPANWAAAPQAVTDDGTDKFIIVTPLVGNRFYRLFKP